MIAFNDQVRDYIQHPDHKLSMSVEEYSCADQSKPINGVQTSCVCLDLDVSIDWCNPNEK